MLVVLATGQATLDLGAQNSGKLDSLSAFANGILIMTAQLMEQRTTTLADFLRTSKLGALTVGLDADALLLMICL